MALKQTGKNPTVDFHRRDFLARCCQSAAAAMIPVRSLGLVLPALAALDSQLERAPDGEFHLHPHYRMPMPLDALLLQTQPGLDEFVTEKYADQIAAILATWSSSLLRSPQDIDGFRQGSVAEFLRRFAQASGVARGADEADD